MCKINVFDSFLCISYYNYLFLEGVRRHAASHRLQHLLVIGVSRDELALLFEHLPKPRFIETEGVLVDLVVERRGPASVQLVALLDPSEGFLAAEGEAESVAESGAAVERGAPIWDRWRGQAGGQPPRTCTFDAAAKAAADA